VALKLAIDSLNFSINRVWIEQRRSQKVRLHVNSFLKGIIAHLKVIICVLIFSVCILITTMTRYVLRVLTFVRILVAAHKNHVLKKVSKPLTFRRIIKRSRIYSNRAVGHSVFRAFFFGVAAASFDVEVLNEDHFDAVGQGVVNILVLVLG